MKKGSKHTEETKRKMSAVAKATAKGRTLDPILVKKGVASRKRKSPFWHSTETIEKIRAASTGVVPSVETKRKISESMRGRKMSLESTANLAWAKRGCKHSKETKEKIKYGVKRYWERKKVEKVKVDREITDRLSEIRGATRHKKERRKIERGD